MLIVLRLRGSFRQTVPANRLLFFFVHPDQKGHIEHLPFFCPPVDPSQTHNPTPPHPWRIRQADRQTSQFLASPHTKEQKKVFPSLDRTYNTHPNNKLGPSVPALDSIRSERDVQESGTKLTKLTKNISVTYYSAPT